MVYWWEAGTLVRASALHILAPLIRFAREYTPAGVRVRRDFQGGGVKGHTGWKREPLSAASRELGFEESGNPGNPRKTQEIPSFCPPPALAAGGC